MHDRDRLDATDLAVAVHRPGVIELCERHGLDANDVASAEVDLVDAPLLRFEVYRADAAGRRYLECHDAMSSADRDALRKSGHECLIAMDVVETALRGDLPAWWTPPALEGVTRQGGVDAAAASGGASS